MDTRSETTAATRLKLRDATVEVISEIGTAAMTMQAVAERADMSLRTVYNHFPSREALLVEAYEWLASSVLRALESVPVDLPPPVRLREIVAAIYASFLTDSPGAAASILATTGVPDLDARLREVRAWRRRELTDVLRPAAKDGSLKLPLKEAAGLAFLFTAFATWHSLTVENGLSQAAALRTAQRALDAALFGS